MQKPTIEDIKYICSIDDIEEIKGWYKMAFFDVIREVAKYYQISLLDLFKKTFYEPKFFRIYEDIYNQKFDKKSLKCDFNYIISTQNECGYLPLSILCFSSNTRQTEKEILFTEIVNNDNIIYWFSDEYYIILNLYSHLPNIFNFDHNGIRNNLICLLLEPKNFFPSLETFLTLEKYNYFKLSEYVDQYKEYLWYDALLYYDSKISINFIKEYILYFEIPRNANPEIVKFIKEKVSGENFIEYLKIKKVLKTKKILLLKIKDILIETELNLVYQALYHSGSQLNDEIIILKKLKRNLYSDFYIEKKNQRLYLFKVLTPF